MTRPRLLHRLLGLLALVASLFMAPGAGAHELTMAEMQLRETAHGRFLWMWTASEKGSVSQDLRPIWPDGCHANDSMVDCGEDGLTGTLGIDGVGKRYSAVLVKIFWLNGAPRVYTLTAGQPEVHLYGAADDERGMVEVAQAYTVLGVLHILTGIDHLLFVISLLLLVGFNRRLIWTISAFTLAHSLTLASSALGWLVLRPPPVEACIALSIVLVAGEALHQRETWARRWPALLAFLFGLVHGLGFAGALKEIGLPEQHIFTALLTFNLGVEIGQLFTVACVFALVRLAARWPRLAQGRTAVLYGIGTVAAYWSWLRLASLFA